MNKLCTVTLPFKNLNDIKDVFLIVYIGVDLFSCQCEQ